MKRHGWLAVVMAGSVSLCSGQELARTEGMAEETGAEILREANPWRITGGLIYKNWLFEHDALQQRVPASSDKANEWEEGTTDGSGWGFLVRVGRSDGRLNIAFMKSDYRYELDVPASVSSPGAPPPATAAGSQHQVDTIARDFEVSWSQVRGRNDQSEWGSTLGFRYLGMQKDVEVTEGEMTVDGSGNMNWLMLLGGYDGNWRPFDTPVVQAHGYIHFFLAEASGTARSGSDEDWTDGVVSETYGNEYSLAYGARVLFGVDLAVTKDVLLTVDYMREYLNSFDATDTGIVVFPDNSDALFIENHHAVVIGLHYIF